MNKIVANVFLFAIAVLVVVLSYFVLKPSGLVRTVDLILTALGY